MTRQAGVALVSVLLVVAMATVMAVSMITEQQSTIETTRGFLSRGQARQYALGGEELARQILAEDLIEGEPVDALHEAWASDELYFDFEDGEVNLTITDLQGRINLNNLAAGGSQAIALQQLSNLLAAQGMDVANTDRIIDWIDEDEGSRPAGAEDYDYLVFDPPYRAANRPISDISELNLLALPQEQISLISEHLTALPETDVTLNVNTATPAVLQSLSPRLTVDAAQTLIERSLEQEGFRTVQAFLQAPELAGLGVQANGLGVQSAFFEVQVIARYQDRFSYLTTVIHRNATDGSMRVLQRDFSRQFSLAPANAVSDSEADDG